MPITGIGSYGPTTLEFNTNWKQANLELGSEPIVLVGDYDQLQFQADRLALVALIGDVSIKAENARDAAAERDNLKSALLVRVKQLRAAVASKIGDPLYLRDLVLAPQFSDAQSKFSDPLLALNRLWAKINTNATALGLSTPLTLQNGYTQAQFTADLALLPTIYEAAEEADEKVGFARSVRNAAMKAIYERLKQYRKGAESALPPDSPALENLPRLTPKAGTTPPPVALSGHYDPVAEEAVFEIVPPNIANIARLQARGCTGTKYHADDEEVIADLPANARELRTKWGLSAPGAKISVKMYVETTDGNENGGKAVVILRPVT